MSEAHMPSPVPTYEDILTNAQHLAPTSAPTAINGILEVAASLDLTAVQRDHLLKLISAKTGTTKSALKADLKQLTQQQQTKASDLGLMIAQKVLGTSYGKTGLKRCTDGSLWVFDKTHWRETTEGQIRSVIQIEATAHLPFAGGKSLVSLVNSAHTCLIDLLGTDMDVMGMADAPLPLINCANGEVWIRPDGSPELKPHNPASRMTYCLPISYDPEAVCPLFDQALLDIFAEASDPADVARHWNEFTGYAIQPDRSIPSFWMLIGHGSNGKSMLLKTLERLVGPDAALNDQIGTFSKDHFNAAALAGKLILIDDDMAEGTTLPDGLLKKISEAKTMSARHAYGRRKFNFVNRALPIMAGNSYPRTHDVSLGMFRRAQIFPFDHVFTKKEINSALFPEIWAEEMPGVLNRALEGLKRLVLRKGFEMPEACRAALEEFKTHAVPLMAFIEDRCIHDPDARLLLSQFREALKAWAHQQGVKQPVADKTLKRKLEGLGYKVSKVHGYPTIFGLDLTIPI
ncbi:Gp9a (fragment) [uncultured Alphaproteobacteria bacterium]|uniref:Gp9a n=1 Tax=uncultured Alphaproteobacteria bacterium TaxID=91750 RepID=A0A212JZW7_9PROT